MTYTDLFELKSIKHELNVLIKLCACVREHCSCFYYYCYCCRRRRRRHRRRRRCWLLTFFFSVIVIIKWSEKRHVLCKFYRCHVSCAHTDKTRWLTTIINEHQLQLRYLALAIFFFFWTNDIQMILHVKDIIALYFVVQ